MCRMCRAGRIRRPPQKSPQMRAFLVLGLGFELYRDSHRAKKAGAPRSGRRGSFGRGEDLVPTHRTERAKAESLVRAREPRGRASPRQRCAHRSSDRSHAYVRVLGDGHDTVIRALGKRRSQTRLSDIAVPNGKPHRGAIEPQNEVLAYLHQSHRSGRRKRDSAQATRPVSRAPRFGSRAGRRLSATTGTPSEGGLPSLDRGRSRRRRFRLRRSGHPRTRGKCASRSARLPPSFSMRVGLYLSTSRLRRRHEFRDALQERLIGAHESASLELRERDVLGLERRPQVQRLRELPRAATEDGVAEETDLQSVDVCETPAGLVLGDIPSTNRLVHRRESLGAPESRSVELPVRRNVDRSARQSSVAPESMTNRATLGFSQPEPGRRGELPGARCRDRRMAILRNLPPAGPGPRRFSRGPSDIPAVADEQTPAHGALERNDNDGQSHAPPGGSFRPGSASV